MGAADLLIDKIASDREQQLQETLSQIEVDLRYEMVYEIVRAKLNKAIASAEYQPRSPTGGRSP